MILTDLCYQETKKIWIRIRIPVPDLIQQQIKTLLTFRVKEISMGIISNMVYHEAIFSGIMEKDRCLGKHFFFMGNRTSEHILLA